MPSSRPLGGAAVATSSMATELIKGKTIKEAEMVTNKVVMEALDGLPPAKVHCSVLAEEAIAAPSRITVRGTGLTATANTQAPRVLWRMRPPGTAEPKRRGINR